MLIAADEGFVGCGELQRVAALKSRSPRPAIHVSFERQRASPRTRTSQRAGNLPDSVRPASDAFTLDMSANLDDAHEDWAFESSHALFAVAVAGGVVPSVERTRDQRPKHRTLPIAEQQQIISLSAQRLDLPSRVHDIVDALAREAPPPQQLSSLRCSPLVDAEPLPDLARETDGA